MAASWPEHKKVKPLFCVEELLLELKRICKSWSDEKVCLKASDGFVVVPLEGRGMGCLATRWRWSTVVLFVKWNDLQGFWARWSDPGGRSTPCHKGGGKGFSTSWIAKISSNFILNFNWENIMIEIFRWEPFSTGLSPCPWRSKPLYSISLIQANTR